MIFVNVYYFTINWKKSAETLIEQNPPVIERIATPTPDYVIHELCAKIPDFKLAWDEDALKPEEFEKNTSSSS